MAIHLLPVCGDLRRHAAENVRSQIFDANPRQNEETAVVRDEADIASARLGAPTDITVATAQVPRRRTPGQASDRAAPATHQIFSLLSHRLFIAKIVVLLEQAVE